MTNNNNPWIENTGDVPDGVGPDTVIEVEYRDGERMEWRSLNDNHKRVYWTMDDTSYDVIRWRFG